MCQAANQRFQISGAKPKMGEQKQRRFTPRSIMSGDTGFMSEEKKLNVMNRQLVDMPRDYQPWVIFF